MEAEHKSKTIEKYLMGDSDDVQIQVNNIVLTDLRKAPYVAQVDIEKVFRTRTALKSGARSTSRASLSPSPVSAERADSVNPLGLMITYLREDQAF